LLALSRDTDEDEANFINDLKTGRYDALILVRSSC
jgi:hypothetical protein